MRSYLFALILTGFMVSCAAPEENTSEAANDTNAEVATEEPTVALQAIDTDEALVATALMAAPEESRAECTVIGYNMAGEFVTFREGTNDLICLTDDPKRMDSTPPATTRAWNPSWPGAVNYGPRERTARKFLTSAKRR
jgi:hypothetical protein